MPGPFGWGRTVYNDPPILQNFIWPAQRPTPDPEPTFEERRQRCADMGLVICTCSGVETERGRKLLYNLGCPIHGSKR